MLEAAELRFIRQFALVLLEHLQAFVLLLSPLDLDLLFAVAIFLGVACDLVQKVTLLDTKLRSHLSLRLQDAFALLKALRLNLVNFFLLLLVQRLLLFHFLKESLRLSISLAPLLLLLSNALHELVVLACFRSHFRVLLLLEFAFNFLGELPLFPSSLRIERTHQFFALALFLL